MKLNKLTIQLQPSYADNAGKYTGEISYEGARGKVELLLDEKASEALLVCIGETITEFAAAAAREVAANVFESVEAAKQIKNPPIES
jgi:triosephosphate isomerase